MVRRALPSLLHALSVSSPSVQLTLLHLHDPTLTVIGLIHLTQQIVKSFKARSTGHVISLGSVAGVEAYVGGGTFIYLFRWPPSHPWTVVTDSCMCV